MRRATMKQSFVQAGPNQLLKPTEYHAAILTFQLARKSSSGKIRLVVATLFDVLGS
jgi:hypothetical protein